MSEGDRPSLPSTPEIDVFIERNWFHLDHGWVDLGADQLDEGHERNARKDAEDAAVQLMEELVRQFNDAVVSAAHYLTIFKDRMARAMDGSRVRPTIDVEGELLGIFARAYVFGFDGVEGCAQELAHLVDLADASRSIVTTLKDELKWVRQVRDSLQHIEERVLGERTRWNKCKRIREKIPTSLFVLGGHSERGFSMTSATGSVVTVEVSEAALASVRSRITALDLSLTLRRAGPVCPACGGSISPHVEGLDGAVGPSVPTIEWRCDRCGFRQPIETQR